MILWETVDPPIHFSDAEEKVAVGFGRKEWSYEFVTYNHHTLQ